MHLSVASVGEIQLNIKCAWTHSKI